MSPTQPDVIDFFISYTGKDKAWAEWIAWHLEHKGYRTLIQAWDFKSGSIFVGDMHRALQKSARVIAVLTPDYMQSGFCQPEWQAAIADDPTGEKGTLVCVRVAKFKPDGILCGRTYIDLVDLSESDANALLLDRLEKKRPKPATPPSFPGNRMVAPAFPGTNPGPGVPSDQSPIPSNLPGGYIGRLFLGREDFLADLRTALTKKHHAAAITQAGPIAAAVAGLGGIGKTHAAVEYAHRHRGDYCALLFVTGDTPEKLHASLAALCGVLHLDAAGPLPSDEPSRVTAAVDWLASHPGWLLIVDNVDTQEAATALTGLLERLTTGHILITSRLHGWADHVETLDLEVLQLPAATDLLLRLTDKHRRPAGDDPAQARRLAELMDGLPLALHQAAGYINEQRLTLAGYLATYQQEAADLLGWFNSLRIPYAGPEELGPRPVLITWKTSFDKLDAETRRWLLVFAHFAPEPIPESLLDSAPNAKDEVKSRHRTAKRALAQAETYSLLTRERAQPRFKLHRLVQQIIRLTAPEADRAAALALGIQLIQESNPGNPLDVRTWPRWNPLQSHAVTLVAHAPDAPAPERLSWLLGQLDNLYDTKGLHAEAERHSRRALKLDEASYGPDHPKVAIRLNNLAQLLQATNRLGEAEPLMRRALGIDEASYGPDHPKVAIRLNNLAALLQATNRLGEAEPQMRRALVIDEASFGPDHPDVARDLNNLAQLLQATNRLGEAEPLMRRALVIDEASYGPDHPHVARDLNNLAQLLKDTNRLGEAEPLMRRALGILVRSLGPEHPNSETARDNYLYFLQALKLPEGEIEARVQAAMAAKSSAP